MTEGQTHSELMKVEGFLSIKEALVESKDFTLLIGPQASGKSIIAKLLLFFRDYISDLFREGVQRNEDKRTFDKRKRHYFAELFPRYSWSSRKFLITYKLNDFEVMLSKRAKDKEVKIQTNSIISNKYGYHKREFQKFLFQKKKDTSFIRRRTPSLYIYARSSGKSWPYDCLPDTLYVPASRAFYAFIREEIMSFLAAEGRLDPILAQFGSFYDFAKKYSDESYREYDPATRKKIMQDVQEILIGEYIRDEGKDWIRHRDSRIELAKASSGQQEILPLLVSLITYPQDSKGNGVLIIEEPEAHLFPKAQKALMDLIVDISYETGVRMLFTSHSPYIISCLNNAILRYQKKGDGLPKEVSAYYVDAGRVQDIIDLETGLIDAEAIDDVSGDIAEELESLLFND